MMLKKNLRIWALILCMLFAVAGPGDPGLNAVFPAALAEEDGRNQLEIQITAKPAEMVEPGDIMLNFSIENISAVEAQNVYLSSADGLLSEPVGQLAADEVQSFNRQHTVTQAELDAGEVSYIISHDDPFDPGAKVNYTVAAAIRRSDVFPQAEFTRQFSSRSVNSGDTLTITYRIRNTGNVALTNLMVQDSLGDYTGGVDRLEVGESRTLISRAVIEEETLSSAMLSFAAEGEPDEIHTQTLSEAPIAIAQYGLEHSFSAGKSAFSEDAADVVLTLRNTGNIDIRNVRVTDESYGGAIADSLLIPAGGAPLELSRSYPLRGEMTFRWRVTGTTDAGKEIAFTTEPAAVSAEAEGVSVPAVLEVTAATPRIRRSGNVRFDVRISNPGSADLQDVTLTEATLGTLRNFAVIPAGDSIERSFSFRVTENTVYNFSIHHDGSGGTAVPVEITIAADGVLPDGAKPGFIEFTGSSIKIGGSSTFAILVIAGLSVLLILIILLWIASRRARLEKQLRIAAEKQRRKEEQGKTARPARAQKNKPKGRT